MKKKASGAQCLITFYHGGLQCQRFGYLDNDNKILA